MNSYKMIVAYDGTAYFGWQKQTNRVTVCGTMEHIFKTLFNAPCQLVAASRTDAGVHAYGQVVLCRTDFMVSAEKLLYAWNNALPKSIMIRSLEETPAMFHPFHDVMYKIYTYTIYTQRPMPDKVLYGWEYRHPIDKNIFKEALQLFIGTHDFRYFSTYEPNVSTIRTIDVIETKFFDDSIVITIQGKSFIRHMIRRIIGAAVAVASSSQYVKEDIIKLLTSFSGVYCFYTAPALGLQITKIVYKN